MNKKIYFKISPDIPALYDARARLCLSEAVGRGFPFQHQGGSGGLGHGATQGNLPHHQEATVTSGWRQRLLSTALKCLVILFSVTWLTACGTALPTAEDGPRIHHIYVVSNGWHTAIIVPTPALVSTGTLPEAADFSGSSFLEFGWGDRTFYQAKEPTLGVTLTAALIPTPAVMHMAALQAPPKDSDSGLEVISVELTEAGFQSLTQALAAEFKRPTGGRAKSISRGLYSHSYFYHAHGKFHLFNTCNTWTARMLREGDVVISSSGIVTAYGLMSRLRETLTVE